MYPSERSANIDAAYQYWVAPRLAQLPPKMGAAAGRRWQRIARTEQYDWREKADGWLSSALSRIRRETAKLKADWDLSVGDSEICAEAERLAAKFRERAMRGWNAEQMMRAAGQHGVDCEAVFAEQIKRKWLHGISNRLQAEKWWRGFLRRNVRRSLEAVARRDLNLVNSRRDLYVSDDGFARWQSQRRRNQALLATLKMINELGQEFALSELVEKSLANPKIRKAELMTRIAGFEFCAQINGDVGEFITITCPSRFHRAHRKNGAENNKYDGSSPRDAAEYLQKVWAQIRAALKREGVEIYGFRVAEPHHDGCPHWHGLFFMPECHRRTFRRIVARYAVRDDRAELGLDYFVSKKAAQQHARAVQAACLARGDAVPTLKSLLSDAVMEADFWREPDWKTYHKVSARVLFKKINWNIGSAAGYIAKYISKNIDGENAFGESIGDTDEAWGTAATDAAQRVMAWASIHGIRQFQQVGGPPVSVWRELRREGMTEDAEENLILAAQAADRGDWAKFVALMGGVLAKRDEMSVRLYKEDGGHANAYGEPRGAETRGVLDAETGAVKISRIHEWTIAYAAGRQATDGASANGRAAAAWTGVNNCTESTRQPENGANSEETLRKAEPATVSNEEDKRRRRHDLLKQVNELEQELALAESPALIKVLEMELELCRHTLRGLDRPLSPLADPALRWDIMVQAQEESEKQRLQSDARIAVRDYIALLDDMMPPVWKRHDEPDPYAAIPTTRARRWPQPKTYDSAYSVLADACDLVKQTDALLASWAAQDLDNNGWDA